jgi:hypothetical protein
MRIVSKIKKDYGNIKDILKNDYFHIFGDIISITYNGSNIYILSNDVYVYNYESNNMNKISTIKINNGKKIEYNNGHLYILDNHLYDYDITNDTYIKLIQGPINKFTVITEYIIYDKNENIYKYTKNNKLINKINKISGNTVDMISDNTNLFLCYDTYVQKYNLSTSYTSNITENISNIISITYDGLLIYLGIENENENLIKIFTKNGLEYTESKINNITKFQDIIYDGNYIYYRDNNMIYKFDESNIFYDYNIQNVDKIKYFYTDDNTNKELISLKDTNLIISNGFLNNKYNFNYSNIIDYAYVDSQKFIINDNNIFILNESINQFPKNRVLLNESIRAYYKYNEDIIYSEENNVISHLYLNNVTNKYIIDKIYKNDLIPQAISYDNSTYYILDVSKILKYNDDVNISDKVDILIKNNSLYENLAYSNIEYNIDDNNVYIKEVESKKVFYINNDSRYQDLIKVDNKIYKPYQNSNFFILSDEKRKVIKIDLNNDNLSIDLNKINIDGKCLYRYNGNILIGSGNYILKYDNNINQLDTITNPFFKGNTDIININQFNGNLILCDRLNKKIIILNTNNKDVYQSQNEYLINDINNNNQSPIDMDIYNNNLYIAVEEDSNIIRYDLNNMNIINCKSLKQILNNDVQINSIKYINDLDGLLVSTNRGLYLLSKELNQIIRTYDKYNNLYGLGYYNNYIYTFDNLRLCKYSKYHYFTETNYTFKGEINKSLSNIEIMNYQNPNMITTNNKYCYVLDNNNILYYLIDDVNNKKYIMYSLYNYNELQNANIIDLVVDNKFIYILKDDNSIDIVKEDGYIYNSYKNIDAKKITLPTKDNSIYYISRDNKIKKLNGNNISIIIENIGINNDEQLFYIYNNKVIKVFNKNNTSMTQLEENIYYSNNNYIYNLNKHGITEDLNINKIAINGMTNDSTNIIICTRNSVEIFNPFDISINLQKIVEDLNNPFKCILVGNFYYVCDTYNHRILKINKNNLSKTILVTGLNYPRGIDYNYKDNYLYIADCGSDRIIKINPLTSAKINLSQIINGLVDLYFDSELLYISSLLQNIVYEIDTSQNNVLNIYLNIEKPYYIDFEGIFLISTNDSYYTKELSYLDLNNIIKDTINRIDILVKNNQIYNTNNKFKLWIDNEMILINTEKNLNNKHKSIITLEKILNTMNHTMDYTDSADSIHTTNLEIFKNRTFLLLKSMVNVFGVFKK